jgi:hypothetical protein
VSLGGTDARLWRQRGIPALVHGPFPRGMAQADEHVEIEESLHVVRRRKVQPRHWTWNSRRVGTVTISPVGRRPRDREHQLVVPRLELEHLAREVCMAFVSRATEGSLATAQPRAGHREGLDPRLLQDALCLVHDVGRHDAQAFEPLHHFRFLSLSTSRTSRAIEGVIRISPRS